ncbi:hypothetical protein [Mangrovicoccus sp. HB161399]|uniref:hypothetical protein n=1 Tax=Mangrovicoccus sp. HB161399 TaxID=2720392 RepID=UPI0015525578|nr:hypothetical protein [Mangrovicoccus sp. HB161399]
MNTSDLAFDQTKVLNWWTGRISNAEFAAWTGQTERDIRLILDTPFMRREIQGGGRGSKTTRRVSRTARNAVAIIAALRRAGMSIEAATDLLNTVPVLAGFPTETIDFSPSTLESVPLPIGGLVMLSEVQPKGGWLPTDIVPDHIFRRRCRPTVKIDAGDRVSIGDIAWFPEYLEQGTGGKLPLGFRAFGEPIYRPEIDPFGLLEYGNNSPDVHDAMDVHFFVVDGRWVFVRHSNPAPREFALDSFQWMELRLESRFDHNSVTFDFEPIAEIEVSKRASTYIRGDQEKESMANLAWQQPKTKLDVNATVAVRDMKRVALGLISPPNP